jgi:hypothetical protein
MIIYLKTAKMLSITLMRRPRLARAGIETAYELRLSDVHFWRMLLK